MGTETQFLQNIKSLILDMDGVLWRDDDPIVDLCTEFQKISQLGLKVVLATNNSTKTIEQYLNKVKRFGVTLEAWQIINSSLATADILKDRFPAGGPIYTVGEIALIDTLDFAGFPQSEENVLAVVAGMDRTVNYGKLLTATRLILNGAPFIATNPDRTFPTPQGLAPGAGAILASITASTGVEPDVAGKPSPGLYNLALKRLGNAPEETLVVGDRPETDIEGGQKIGCRTALVLSGVVNPMQAAAWKPSPDLILRNLSEVIDYLWQARNDKAMNS
jgi:4-nitrophenyl phosphatase